MNARQFATTLRRTSTRRAGCSVRRGYSTDVDPAIPEQDRINAEVYDEQQKTAHSEIPEGMQRVLSMKEKRTKFQRLSMPYLSL